MTTTIGIHSGHGENRCEDTAFRNSRVFSAGIGTLTEEKVDKLGLCDGVGGNAGGKAASEFVCRRFAETDFSHMEEQELWEFLRQLNRDLLDHAKSCPGRETMATTLSCILRAQSGYYLIHGGNTRIWVLQGAYLKQLTSDHTHKARLLRAGQKEAAAATPGNRIYCALGGGNPDFARSFEIRKLEYNPLPSTLILTSDGIHDHLSPDCLEALLAEPGPDRNRAESIIRQALRAGSRDDCTLIISRNN